MTCWQPAETAKAVAEVVERMGGIIRGNSVVVELTFLKGRQKLPNYKVLSVLKY